MAYYKLWQWFSTFRTTPYVNMIAWYSEEVKTPEQRELEKKLKEKRRAQALRAYSALRAIMGSSWLNDTYFKFLK